MNCASRQAALIRLAATGGEPISELRAHLRECPSCRAVFESERSLLTAIDAGLRVATHVEVPASLLPRVRARIAELPARDLEPTRLRAIVLAIAAAAVLLVSLNTLRHRQQTQSTPHSPGPVAASSSANRTLTTSVQPAPAEIGKKSFAHPGPTQRPPILGQHSAEILVAADQEVLLAQYATQLSHRRSAGAVFDVQSASPESQPLEIALIQIAELDVKPLAEQLELQPPPGN